MILKRISIPIRQTSAKLGMVVICLAFLITKVSAQDVTCFDEIEIEPSFIAFTTTKESKLADWYQATYGLSIVKRFSFADGAVSGILMNRGEFVVEVFNRDDALARSDYQRKTKPEQWSGVMKFGIYTNASLSTLKQCLSNQGVEVGRIFNDKNLKIDLLEVVDPEQNVLEIISRSNMLVTEPL